MTKFKYPSYREALLDNGVDVISGDVKIVGLDATYVVSTAHNFLDDIPGGAIIATSGNLASKTKTGGVFNAADASLGSPAAGDTITQLVAYRDSGSAATSELLAYTDEDAAGTGLAIATNGEAITLDIDDVFGLFAI